MDITRYAILLELDYTAPVDKDELQTQVHSAVAGMQLKPAYSVTEVVNTRSMVRPDQEGSNNAPDA